MKVPVIRWFPLSFVAGIGLLACISDPEFHQVGEGAPATGSTAPPTVTTPPSTAPADDDAGPADDGGDDEDPANYVPDGGMAGPGTVPCGGQVCTVGRICCSGKCKNPKSKC